MGCASTRMILPPRNLARCASANARLQLLNLCLVGLHGARTDGNVVVLGKNPGVKVGRHIITNVHFRQFVVVRHLIFRQPNPLLKGDRVVVITRIDRFCHP